MHSSSKREMNEMLKVSAKRGIIKNWNGITKCESDPLLPFFRILRLPKFQKYGAPILPYLVFFGLISASFTCK